MLGTLVEILDEKSNITNKGVMFIESSDKEEFLSFKELYHSSLKILSYFQGQGLKPKDELVFQLDDNKTFVEVFWACILGGIIPVPLSVGGNEDHRQKLFNVWKILNNPYLIISSENLDRLKKHAEINEEHVLFKSLHDKVVRIDKAYNQKKPGLIYRSKESDIAYVQFSSGSTGNPKGVILTHKNLIVNMKSISKGSGYTQEDSKLSWMPLTHDMGLIGFHLCPLFCGMNHYLMPTNLFIRRPALWLDKATQYKATILCSPNFGYKYLLKQFDRSKDYKWNLSSVRMIYNGAEPISEDICNEFVDELEVYGLKKTSMYPVYGLAEASLAVSFSDLNEEVVSIHIDRAETLVGSTVSMKPKGENAVSFVNVGKSVPYCSISINDDCNTPCGEATIGHIKIKGDNVTSGYYNNAEAAKKVITSDGWLDTGDLGFMYDNCLYITGRSKDILFVNGQNFYPHDIERSLEVVEGIELGKVVCAGRTGESKRDEEIIIFVLFKKKAEKFIELLNRVRKHVNQVFGFEPDYIIPVREIPKTTSGKVQRFKLLEEVKRGIFNEVIDEIKELLTSEHIKVNYIGSSNKTEQKLIDIWAAVLLHKNFGITQRFFDVGGNSLKGAQLLSMVHKEFGVELEYNHLFEKQTIQETALIIDKQDKLEYNSIPVVPEHDSYPLSSTQRRLYFLWELDKTSSAYNIPVAFNIIGKLDIKKFEKAINLIIQRHEVLRSSFFMFDGEPRQKNSKKIEFTLSVTDIELQNCNEELINRIKPFNLFESPLFRIELLMTSSENSYLFLDFHHIISDGISISLFMNELFKIYQGENLQALEIQYKDYVNWANENIDSGKLKKQEDYWINQYKENTPVLNLPTDYTRPLLMEYRGEKLEFQLNTNTVTKLKELSLIENTSLFTLLFAAYTVVLSKYTGQEDIVVGIPVSGRSHLQFQVMQGMFVNNLAIRSILSGDLTFIKYLRQVRNKSLHDLNNKEFPFETLVELVEPRRDVSRNSLFDTMFVYQNMELPTFVGENLSIERRFFDPGFSKYDISLEVFELGDKLSYYIEYSTALFKRETIERFACFFKNILDGIVDNPNVKLSKLSLVSEDELIHSIHKFNNTQCDYPKDKAIHQLIENVVVEEPERVAVRRGNIQGEKDYNNCAIHELTYAQLNEKSNQFANFLRKKGVMANNSVAVAMDRSPELLFVILGILKSGACFLPIEKDLPEERIKYIFKDSSCRLFVTDNAFELKDKEPGVDVINIEGINQFSNEPKTIKNINSSDDLAYIIYTSGTTGNPKGVMIKHQSLVNYAIFANQTYIKGEKVSFPLYTSISFDLTITSIFAPLISGNSIVTYPEIKNSLPLEDLLVDNQIQILKATPSHLKMLKEFQLIRDSKYFSNIKRIVVGGESFTTQLAKQVHSIFNQDIEIYNEYGPTEATVGCMIYKYNVKKDNRQTVPIGVPIDNSQIYLLDNYLEPVPEGVTGELYISGDCLASGYLFNEKLTSEKFIENPFTAGQKIYKTGDLAKRLSDGDIEFVGRVDQQVKINGYRIELEEIEQQILLHKDVKESILLQGKNDTLLAYVVLKDAVSKVSDIKTHLEKRLPGYMIPKQIIPIEEIPLTLNGKINFKQLPEPSYVGNEKAEANNEIQKAIATVWQDVLNEYNIGITDNFFELGGDSIKAVQIASRLFEKNISVNVKDILTYQTIEQLCLQAEITDGTSQYEQGIVEGEVELNPIQLWFFEQKFENPHFYNQSVLLKFKKPINKEILQKTFKILIEHHDGLRMNYNSEKQVMFYNNKYLQETLIIEEYAIKVPEESERVHLKSIDDNANAKSESCFQSSTSNLEDICQKVKSSFNIENTLLFKAAIIRDSNSDLLFLTAHHLIIDGVSWRVLLEDFYRIYTSLEEGEEIKLPKKTASLLDWNDKLNDFSRSEELKNQIKYWKEECNCSAYSIDDSTYGKTKVKDMQQASFQLNKDETQFLLTDAHKAYNTNVEILLVAALVKTLNEWENFGEIVIEMESHGRQLDEVDSGRTVGWFTSMFPVKFRVEHDLGEQIKHIKEKIRKIPNNGLGYGVLRYYNESLNNSYEFNDVRFNYLGQFDGELNNNLFNFKQDNIDSDICDKNHYTANLEVNVMIVSGMLVVEVNCCLNVIREKSIDLIMKNFKNAIIDVIDYLKTTDGMYFTPSDFDAVELDEEDLKVLFG